MKLTKRQLRRCIQEAMELDLEIGDVILAGKFKNKRKIVKTIGSDNLGQPTINGMKVLNFRIEKLMPKDKWSKKSKEALEFADGVNEMKITKRQLRRIIHEAWTGADDAAQAHHNKARKMYRDIITQVFKDTYVGGSAAEGGQTLMEHFGDDAERVIYALVARLSTVATFGTYQGSKG